ncbi:hypothetical protein GTW24_18730 [Vibrio cholerae]|nr:hypothetical protein [Vibrio cholerae]
MNYMKALNIDVRRAVSFLMILLMILTSIYMAFNEKELAASICILSFSLGLVFFNIDKYSKIKGPGFETELRQEVEKANLAIKELRQVLTSVAEPTIALLSVSSPFEYLPLHYKLEYAKNISDTLNDLDASNAEIEKVVATIYDAVENKHKRKIAVKLNDALPPDEKLFTNIDGYDFSNATLNEWNTIAKSHAVDISDVVEDYNFFIKNKALRTPDDWQG